MPYSDEELIERARAATEIGARNQIIEELFQRHYQRVALWCLRWTQNQDAAQDLAQDIFLKVHRSLHLFQGQSKFTTWLFMVCRNHCINAGMTARSKDSQELDEALSARLASAEPNPEQAAETNARWQMARNLVDRHLDETERKVFLLHHVEGWSLPAVSRSLALTNASGAKAYLVSAQRKLKAALARGKARES